MYILTYSAAEAVDREFVYIVFGSARIGSDPIRPARLGSARIGLARLGLARIPDPSRIPEPGTRILDPESWLLGTLFTASFLCKFALLRGSKNIPQDGYQSI